MVSYLTNVGQVDLLSNQLVARQCYQLFIQEQRGEKNSKNPPLKDQNPRVAIIVRHRDQGEREGSVGRGPPGKNDVGQARKVHLR